MHIIFTGLPVLLGVLAFTDMTLFNLLHLDSFFNLMIFMNFLLNSPNHKYKIWQLFLYSYLQRWHKVHAAALIWEIKLVPDYQEFLHALLIWAVFSSFSQAVMKEKWMKFWGIKLVRAVAGAGSGVFNGTILNYIFYCHIIKPVFPSTQQHQRACVEFIVISTLFGSVTGLINYCDHVIRDGWEHSNIQHFLMDQQVKLWAQVAIAKVVLHVVYSYCLQPLAYLFPANCVIYNYNDLQLWFSLCWFMYFECKFVIQAELPKIPRKPVPPESPPAKRVFITSTLQTLIKREQQFFYEDFTDANYKIEYIEENQPFSFRTPQKQDEQQQQQFAYYQQPTSQKRLSIKPIPVQQDYQDKQVQTDPLDSENNSAEDNDEGFIKIPERQKPKKRIRHKKQNSLI